jgi:hypothetical protein
MKMPVFWDVVIVLMMEAVSTSEMSVDIYQITWRSIQEGSRLDLRICLCTCSA